MINIRHILQEKGNEIWSVTPQTSVLNALKLMADKNIGALVVLEEDKLVGIFSERDYARKVILKGKASKDTAVKEIMTSVIVTVRPSHTVEECMELMTDKRVRHLPVIDEDRLLGVISIGDVVKALISDKEFMIKQLEHYITGTP
jgi:CBS domain-containing protein